jgi:hypothetical protein
MKLLRVTWHAVQLAACSWLLRYVPPLEPEYTVISLRAIASRRVLRAYLRGTHDV